MTEGMIYAVWKNIKILKYMNQSVNFVGMFHINTAKLLY